MQAYLYATYTQGNDNPSEADRTISVDGTDHVLPLLGPDASTDLSTARGDVTAQVKTKVGSGGGVTDFVIDNDPARSTAWRSW